MRRPLLVDAQRIEDRTAGMFKSRGAVMLVHVAELQGGRNVTAW